MLTLQHKTTRIIYKKRQLKQHLQSTQKAGFFGDPAAAPTLRLAEGVFLPTMKTMMINNINNTNAWCQLVYKSLKNARPCLAI